MKVRVPSPLRSYTGGAAVVEACGATVDEVLTDLDRQYPGLRFRAVDEQGRLRQHLRLYLNRESIADLGTAVAASDELTLMQALSGG